MAPKTPAVIVSVAHLDDEERTLVLGVLLEELLTWVRSLPGSRGLRALVVFDEVYGFLPPHPNNPPTKRPLVQLVLIATQNPMDLGYRVVMRDMRAGPAPMLLQPRYAMTYMRGPMTRSELMRAAGGRTH